MAASDKTTIGTNFNSSGSGYFLDNTTREISPADIRLFVDAVLQSYPNILDNAYDGLKGLKPGISTIAGLKAISTATSSTGIFVSFRDTGNSNVFRSYELVSGTDVESSPRTIRPTDYATTTNEKVWKLSSVTSIAAWNMSTNAFPTGGVEGQLYYGTEVTTRTTLVDTAGNLLPTKVLAIALQDNPTTAAHFAFFYPIY